MVKKISHDQEIRACGQATLLVNLFIHMRRIQTEAQLGSQVEERHYSLGNPEKALSLLRIA
jgi:hypothetical protein